MMVFKTLGLDGVFSFPAVLLLRETDAHAIAVFHPELCLWLLHVTLSRNQGESYSYSFNPTPCRKEFCKPLPNPYATQYLADFNVIELSLDLEGLSVVVWCDVLFFFFLSGLAGMLFYCEYYLGWQTSWPCWTAYPADTINPSGRKKGRRNFLSAKTRQANMCKRQITMDFNVESRCTK